MSSKVAHYLQEHLAGEVMTSVDARQYFSTDSSIFTIPPAIVVYPRNENDIRKAARFTWQLAERGRVIPLTSRGAGTDLSGAALGSGILLVFPAHMNKIVEFDSKSGVLVTEPGANYGKLQQTLQTHGRFLPPYPASLEYSTIGGAIANNASGDKGIKYGATRSYVSGLRVVLANGEIIETARLNKRELNKKLGLATFEGEVYRSIDTLLEENKEIVENFGLAVAKNASGYGLLDVKRKDGSFDLTPLLVGSQGTLGIITEATLETEVYNPETTLVAGMFRDLQNTQEAILELRKFSDAPSSLEMVDGRLLEFVNKINPNQLKGLVEKPYPGAVLFVEFDGSDRHQKKAAKKARKLFEKLGAEVRVETDMEQQVELWKIRQASSTVVLHAENHANALPVIEDGVVPLDKIAEFIEAIYRMFDQNQLPVAVWGHAGEGNLHVQPHLNLGQVGGRQKAFKLMDEYYKLIVSLGGSLSGENNDGRLRAPYLESMYGAEMYQLFQKVKKIFDPYNTLNPGVKINVDLVDIKPLLRQSYTMDHLYDHLPRS